MTVETKKISGFPLREKEVLRYAGYAGKDTDNVSEEIRELLYECMTEAQGVLYGQLCFIKLPVHILDGLCDFGSFSVQSKKLAENLAGCEEVLLMAATAGVGIDRLISRYTKIAPSRALIFQAIGTELVETVCNRFCNEYRAEQGCKLRPRFSPGYGDLPLELQKDILKILDCKKNIGLTLNDNFLMSPSKSVTAFAGITRFFQK